MRSVQEISQKECIDLLGKCWMTHDGMWFFHCLQEFGIAATNKINKSAIQSLSSIEINRIKHVLEIKNRFDPEIHKCSMHFTGKCAGNIYLFEQAQAR